VAGCEALLPARLSRPDARLCRARLHNEQLEDDPKRESRKAMNETEFKHHLKDWCTVTIIRKSRLGP